MKKSCINGPSNDEWNKFNVFDLNFLKFARVEFYGF